MQCKPTICLYICRPTLLFLWTTWAVMLYARLRHFNYFLFFQNIFLKKKLLLFFFGSIVFVWSRIFIAKLLMLLWQIELITYTLIIKMKLQFANSIYHYTSFLLFLLDTFQILHFVIKYEILNIFLCELQFSTNQLYFLLLFI